MALRSFLHLASIAVIMLLASVAWSLLAEVITRRTHTAQRNLGGDVRLLWGGPQQQRPPEVDLMVHPDLPDPFRPAEQERDPASRNGGPAPASPGPAAASSEPSSAPRAMPGPTSPHAPPKGGAPVTRSVPLSRSRVRVDLDLDQRRKGLLWYATFRATFRAHYTVHNDGPEEAEARFTFHLPSAGGVYDDFRMLVDGESVKDLFRETVPQRSPALETTFPLAPDEKKVVEVHYTTQGLNVWSYPLSRAGRTARDFELVIDTDFRQVDFSPATLSPTEKTPTEEGWELVWRYENLVGGRDIAVVMPGRLNPGPLAARIAEFAPVSLVFFLGVLFFLYILRGIPLHPVHYAFLAAGFFSFHLLFAHLVDHIDLLVAFAASAAVSLFLVISYLRIVISPQFAFFQAGALQLLYLVFFSLAHFWEGWTGLAVTIGGIVTLFVVMQLTARLDWETVFPLTRKKTEPA